MLSSGSINFVTEISSIAKSFPSPLPVSSKKILIVIEVPVAIKSNSLIIQWQGSLGLGEMVLNPVDWDPTASMFTFGSISKVHWGIFLKFAQNLYFSFGLSPEMVVSHITEFPPCCVFPFTTKNLLLLAYWVGSAQKE